MFLFLTGAMAFPLTVVNCGFEFTYEAAPERAVTMNQAATEIMLALGLEEHMIGTAYLDDTILPEYKDAYESIPVLSATYPSREDLMALDPDFIYASYSSAFKNEYAGPRANLTIGNYVSPAACANRTLRPSVVDIDDVFGEIQDIADICGVSETGTALTSELQSDLDAVNNDLLDFVDLAATKVFWFDSFGSSGVYAGACCGAPGMIMRLLGVTNVFEDRDGSWATVSWDDVVAADPDLIVLVNASWDTADEKIHKLAAFNLTQDYVTLDFSYSTPNIRNVRAVQILARYMIEQLLQGNDGSSDSKSSSFKSKYIIIIVVVIVVVCMLVVSGLYVYQNKAKPAAAVPLDTKATQVHDVVVTEEETKDKA